VGTRRRPDSSATRRLEPARIDELVGLVLGEATPRTIAAKLFHETGGDVRLLLARLLVMVQEAPPADSVLHIRNGAGPDPANPALRLAGDHWTLTFAGQTVHLRDTRGLRYIAALIDRPAEAVHALDLVRWGGREVHRNANPDRARQTVTKCIGLALTKIDRCHPALAAHLRASLRRGLRCTYRPVRDT